MPSIASLVLEGGPCRSRAPSRRVFTPGRLPTSTSIAYSSHVSPAPLYATRYRSNHLPTRTLKRPLACTPHGYWSWEVGNRHAPAAGQPMSTDPGIEEKKVWESETDMLVSNLGLDAPAEAETPHGVLSDVQQGQTASIVTARRKRFLRSRRLRKRQRKSGPELILGAMNPLSRNLYLPKAYSDLRYIGNRRHIRGTLRRPPRMLPPLQDVSEEQEQITLYTILARYLEEIALRPTSTAEVEFTAAECMLLKIKGYSPTQAKQWASTLVNRFSIQAVQILRRGPENPPFFLVLLYLHRRTITTFSLGLVMRHIEKRLLTEEIEWNAFKILVTRLLRHARTSWPESIPWIASLFTTQAAKVFDKAFDSKYGLPTAKVSEWTRFCNQFLHLLSFPSSIRAFISIPHQETAQFTVLRFMATRDPPLIVTRRGFRAVVRNQLGHAKTPQEQEWARLKGAGWPPWKESHTALDEEKGFEFGMSRAMHIIQRMSEAGYATAKWEEIMGIYAGWDTDHSPTIQTRTLLPHLSPRYKNQSQMEQYLWAGRVQATRTRREAWACFLAYESAGVQAAAVVYGAMFEKLAYPEMDATEGDPAFKSLAPRDTAPLPGDTKRPWPDSKSPFKLVHIGEPVPSLEQFYHRMRSRGLTPRHRLLAFLLQYTQNFEVAKDIFQSGADSHAGLRDIIRGFTDSLEARKLPNYLLTAVIQFLCRFGYYMHEPAERPSNLPPKDHAQKLFSDRHYMLEYAYTLLVQLCPSNRDAWTRYMRKLIQRNWKSEHMSKSQHARLVQYRILFGVVDIIHNTQQTINDGQLRVLATCVTITVGAAVKNQLHDTDKASVLATSSPRLRALFHELVHAHVDPDPDSSTHDSTPLPPHIPDPQALHVYVRALGMLRDYEGLYSFISWACTNHAEITKRVLQEHNGPITWRKTLIALRASFDGGLAYDSKRAPDDLNELAKNLVQGVEEWGGWPSETEVELYSVKKRW
ncbi:hypothetical protein EJ04DRAFT_550014 [Polyplosphaeria fusca]|uniref:Uncharacterized protein n=1 Tax=Polyplosphaeria fusca TaxID=682080 RepID=A0A9P4R7N4_9PLEO|nr:hypothetical protein EJ04DRAFT_550014 [Polyplosphaeria fusca]